MRKLPLTSILPGILLLIILVGGCAVAEETTQQPILPQTFYGTVEVAGGPAPDGVRVEAEGDGVVKGSPHNPIFTQEGMYGKPGGLDPNKLLVQGSIATGSPIEFYVGGVKAEVFDVGSGEGWQDVYVFKPGEVTDLNLRITTEVTPEITFTATPTTSSVLYQVTTSATSASGGVSVAGVSDPGSAPLTGSATPKVTSAGAGSSPAQTLSMNGQPDGGSSPGEVVPGSDDETLAAPVSTGQPSFPSWILGAAFVILVMIGAAAYYTTRKKENADEDTSKKDENE